MKTKLKNKLGLFLVLALNSCTLSNKQEETAPASDSAVATAEQTKPTVSQIRGVNFNGDSIRFSDIKSKVILVEFWASWCPPCRKFNPGLVDLYGKYQSKGFEILSISLDHRADKWKNAVVQDQLSWPYHISDLKGWDSYWAVKFGIESIPANFLVDSTGQIIASDMDHEALEQTLVRLLK